VVGIREPVADQEEKQSASTPAAKFPIMLVGGALIKVFTHEKANTSGKAGEEVTRSLISRLALEI